jgi:hypothetical protein
MVEKVKTMDGKMMHDVSRSFTNFLALANSAENHHRMRKLRSSLIAEDSELGLWPKIDSCGGGVSNLLARNGGDAAVLAAALKSQTVEIVLTAHPTEVNRRTLLKKLHRIKRYLEQMDSTALTRYERAELQNKLTAEISSIWGSDFLRRSKPTPVEESRSGLAVVEQVLWKALPSFLRKLDDVSRSVLGEPLPLSAAPIKMASWMGGDRDGEFSLLHIVRTSCNNFASTMSCAFIDIHRSFIGSLNFDVDVGFISCTHTCLRQPERDSGGDARGEHAVSLDGGHALPRRHRRAQEPAVRGLLLGGAAHGDRRVQRAVPRGAKGPRGPAAGDASVGRGLPEGHERRRALRTARVWWS